MIGQFGQCINELEASMQKKTKNIEELETRKLELIKNIKHLEGYKSKLVRFVTKLEKIKDKIGKQRYEKYLKKTLKGNTLGKVLIETEKQIKLLNKELKDNKNKLRLKQAKKKHA